jgi:hypothetical protein
MANIPVKKVANAPNQQGIKQHTSFNDNILPSISPSHDVMSGEITWDFVEMA